MLTGETGVAAKGRGHEETQNTIDEPEGDAQLLMIRI